MRDLTLHRKTSAEVELTSPEGQRQSIEPGVVSPRVTKTTIAANQKIVWIDIDNSPHVPFFLPIVEELQNRGIEIVLTARAAYQVCELIKLFSMPCKVVGRHYGKNKLLKVLGNCLRAAELLPMTIARRPDLAISHGSRAQVLVCKSLGIPTLVMHDYEHSTKTGFIEPSWTLMPDVIPDRVMSKKTERLLKYQGLKEDVYVPQFRPDASILSRLGLDAKDLIVTLRPPATEAHYHNPPRATCCSKRPLCFWRSSRICGQWCFREAYGRTNKSGRNGQT